MRFAQWFLPDDGASVGVARRASKRQCQVWGLPDLIDDCSLVVSELVTNALVHGRAPVTLHLRQDDGELVIGVHDAGAGRPGEAVADGDAEGGRGMTIVDALSERVGVTAQPPGKVVWASLAWPAAS
jgi:anti-sigma regulatory factor (Ser/Thr protein kinase)